MAEIVNFRRFIKQKGRKLRADKADENAAKFGRTKEQRLREAKEAQKAKDRLDGHFREET
jgi:hypothetical protein